MKMTKEEAIKIAVENGINFNEDFHVLSSGKVDTLVDLAKKVGYRKPESASGSRGRYFFYHLKRAIRNPVQKVKAMVHPQALEALKRVRADEKAGHSDAADYWRGQASGYFLANPLVKAISGVTDRNTFIQKIENKYGSKVKETYHDHGYEFFILANGDEIQIDVDFKSRGKGYGIRGKGGSLSPYKSNHYEYSEFGYKPKGKDKFSSESYLWHFGAGHIAFAKAIGLSDTQIKQAEKDGIPHIDDVLEELAKIAGLTLEEAKRRYSDWQKEYFNSPEFLNKGKKNPFFEPTYPFLNPTSLKPINIAYAGKPVFEKNGVYYYVGSRHLNKDKRFLRNVREGSILIRHMDVVPGFRKKPTEIRPLVEKVGRFWLVLHQLPRNKQEEAKRMLARRQAGR